VRTQHAIRSEPAFGKGMKPVGRYDGLFLDAMTPRRDLPCSMYLGYRNRAPARLMRLDGGQEEKLVGQDSEHSRITRERERNSFNQFLVPT